MNKPAASVIVPVDARFVGITRGTNVSDVTFPGGRAYRSDATPRHTAVRELYEETGIVVLVEDLDEVIVREDGGHYTFFARRAVDCEPTLESVPFEGYVRLYPPSSFVQPTCRHRETARQAFDALGVSPRRSTRSPRQ